MAMHLSGSKSLSLEEFVKWCQLRARLTSATQTKAAVTADDFPYLHRQANIINTDTAAVSDMC